MESLEEFRQYRVVLLAQAAAVFRHEAGFKLNVRGDQTNVDLRFMTRFDEMPSGHPVPREICFEANLVADNVDMAVDAARQAASWLVPILAFVANAEVSQPKVHLAFETTENSGRREFLQFHYPEQKQPPGRGRLLDVKHLAAVVDAYDMQPEPRVWRCLAQYNFALGHWFEGNEFLALSHLWMAVEALMPLVVADVCRGKSKTLEELAQAYDLDRSDPRWRNNLDGRVRVEQIFQGDSNTHKLAKGASDGLEHGFAEADEIQTNAVAVCAKVFQYVRTAILEHLQISQRISTEMDQKEPIDTRSMKKFVRAYLCGQVPADQLAADDGVYPLFTWSTSIKGVKENDDNLEMELEESFKARFGAGVTFENFGMGIRWRPTTREAQATASTAPVPSSAEPPTA